MDSSVFKDLSQSEFMDFGPALIAQLGKLQGQFIRGDDVLLPLCRILADSSGAESVMILSRRLLASDEMPADVTCWCRDSMRYITLWRQVKDWPLLDGQRGAHQWQRFVVWPIEGLDVNIFFYRPGKGWLSFLTSYQTFIADSISGMLLQQSQDWQQSRNAQIIKSIDTQMYQSIVSNSEDMIVVASRQKGMAPVIMYANAAATAISQYPRSQLIGKSIELFFGDQDDKALELLEAIELRLEFTGELVCSTATGEKVILHTHLIALNEQYEDGSLFTLVGRDITEQSLGLAFGNPSYSQDKLFGWRVNHFRLSLQRGDKRAVVVLTVLRVQTLLKGCYQALIYALGLIHLIENHHGIAVSQGCGINHKLLGWLGHLERLANDRGIYALLATA